MFLNPVLDAALERIAARAQDVRAAYAPGAVPGGDDVAVSQPSADFTLDALSCAPPSNAYFIVRDERGNVAYSRDGSFHIAGGRLVDASGHAILGRRDAGGALQELRVDPVDASLGLAAAARVEPDGSFAYDRTVLDPRTGARERRSVVAGRIALARFPAGTRLQGVDTIASRAPDGVVAHVGLPGDGDFPAIAPFARLRSAVDVDASVSRLKDAYMAFDALAAAESAKGRASKIAMDVVK